MCVSECECGFGLCVHVRVCVCFQQQQQSVCFVVIVVVKQKNKRGCTWNCLRDENDRPSTRKHMCTHWKTPELSK